MEMGQRAKRATRSQFLGLFSMLFALPLAAQEACWPPGAKPMASSAVAPGEPPPSGPTSVYFDGSGSMAGYARPATKGADAESHYRSLILLLPQTLASAGGQVDFYEFGKKTANDKTVFPKLTDAQLQELTKPTYYCPTAVCRYQDSPIADAFKKIVEQPPDTLGMVVTDLFLSNSELVGSGGLELQLPLTKALREGRAIAVLAIKAASTGPIYDLTQIEKNQCYDRGRKQDKLYNCNMNAPQYIGATSRPLFVVMIGPAERILQFKKRLDSDLLKGIPDDHQRFTIFTKEGRRTQSSVDAWSKDAFAPTAKADKGDFLNPFFAGGFPGQQFVLTSRGGGVEANLDFAKHWTPGVPPPANLTFDVKSWYQHGTRCEQMWFAQSDVEARRLVQFDRIAPLKVRVRVAQPSPREAGLLPNLLSYLVAAKISAEGFQPDHWFEEWGYNEPDEMKVLEENPTFFRAKNLPRIGKVLADILQEQAEVTVLGEFRLGLKVH